MLRFNFLKKRRFRKQRKISCKQNDENARIANSSLKNLRKNKFTNENATKSESYFQTCLNNITNIIENNKTNKENQKENTPISSKPFEMKLKTKMISPTDSINSDISTLKSAGHNKKHKINKIRNSKTVPQTFDIAEFKPKIIRTKEHDIRSSIYCKDSKNIIYNISFYTANVKMIPLHLEKREGADFQNDKEIQSENHFFYKTKFFIKSTKFIILKKFFFIPSKYKKKFDRLKGITPPVQVYFKTDSYKDKTKKVISKNDISKKINNPANSGEIYLLWDNIDIKIKAEMFKVELVRLNWIINHKSEVDNKNSAQIITRYKNDIIEFKFLIKQVQVQEIMANVTRSCQVRDTNAYIPYISDINNRRVILALPFSQYFYKNPMTEIFQCNWRNALKKREPRWVTELRHLRQNKIVKEDFSALINRILDQNHSTELHIDLVGQVLKLRGGILSVKKLVSDDRYEMFARDRQKRIMRKAAAIYDPIDVIDTLVPEWNLEEHNC